MCNRASYAWNARKLSSLSSTFATVVDQCDYSIHWTNHTNGNAYYGFIYYFCTLGLITAKKKSYYYTVSIPGNLQINVSVKIGYSQI